MPRTFAAHHAALLVFVVIFTFGVLKYSGQGAKIFSLLASSASSLSGSSTVVFFSPIEEKKLLVGETAQIDVRVNSKVPINAVGATISFPQDTLEIVGVSKEHSFLDLWTEETVINDRTGEVHFSGGTLTSGGHTGVGTLLTLSVRARKAGTAELQFSSAEVFAHDGKGQSLPNDRRTYAYDISTPAAEQPSMAAPRIVYASPSADFNADGKISLADMSILTIQMLASYNAKYDLDMNGSLGLSDLSVFFTKMRE